MAILIVRSLVTPEQLVQMSEAFGGALIEWPQQFSPVSAGPARA